MDIPNLKWLNVSRNQLSTLNLYFKLEIVDASYNRISQVKPAPLDAEGATYPKVLRLDLTGNEMGQPAMQKL